MRQRVNILAAILTTALANTPLGIASMSVSWITGGEGKVQHTHSSTCPDGDGISYLTPDPIENDDDFWLLTTISDDVKNELKDGDTKFPDWTFKYDEWLTGANGDLRIDVYKSMFFGDHLSGVHFEARYIKADGDPANLRWVQYAVPEQPFDPDGDGPIPPADGGVIDPYPNDGTDGGPFYFNSDEIGDYTGGADFDLKFEDLPQLPHPPTSSNGAQFELYLVSWDGDKTASFLGGINWGWHGKCEAIPEPASLALLALGGLGALRRMRTQRT